MTTRLARLRRAWALLPRRAAESRAIHRLETFDDRLLRDMRLTRDGIRRGVRHGLE
jgi:hypothetical protein